MSLSIMLKEDLICGMSKMISEIVSKAVRRCGEVHNFDAEEMLRVLNVNDISTCLVVDVSSSSKAKASKVKVLKSKALVVKSKYPMPFSGKVLEGCCSGLRQNHGLYTQCETSVNCDEKYCKKCGPIPEYGTIEGRLKVGLMEFRDSKGKAPTPFTKVMKKLKISRQEVEEEAGKLNIIINDIHFEEEKVEKREKGRPKKAKKIVELEDDSTDLFAALVAKANAESESDSDSEESIDEKLAIAESIVDSVLDKVSVIAENNEKKAEKEALKAAEKAEKEALKEAEKAEKEALKEAEKAEKEALKEAEKAEKEALKEAEKAEKAEKEALKEAEKQALVQKKEADKALKEAEKQALVQKKEAEKQALLQKKAEKEALLQKKETEKAEKEAEKKKKETLKPAVKASKSKKESSDSETEKKKSAPAADKKVTKEVEEEEDVVKRFEFDGVKYLKSKKTGIIYNMDQEVIGKWNEKTGKIDFQEAESEEEEEEYDE